MDLLDDFRSLMLFECAASRIPGCRAIRGLRLSQTDRRSDLNSIAEGDPFSRDSRRIPVEFSLDAGRGR